jgi:hypothetical protein
MVADARDEREQDEHRGDEQGDLRARADRDVDRQVHLVLGGEVDGHPVLGGVADDRHHDQADEELADAELLGRLDDRADEHLGHDPDGDAGDRERDDRALDRPGVLVVLLDPTRVEEAAVGLQAEQQAGRVGAQEDEGDDERHRLDLVAEVDLLLADARQAAAVDQLEDGRQDQGAGGEQEHQHLDVGGGAVEVLPLALAPADEHRGAHDQQDVAEDRADDRRLDDLLQPGVQREERDDELGEVAEGDVEEAADARAGARGELLGRAAHERRVGITPSAAATKISVASACAISSPMAMKMNGTSR